MPSVTLYWLAGPIMALCSMTWPLRAAIPAGPDGPDGRTDATERKLPSPDWARGDHWVVETLSRPLQARNGALLQADSKPIPWQFAICQLETLAGHICHRIEVRCQAAGNQPQTVLWIDRDSLALRQITTQVPVPNGFETMTVRYDFTAGQTAPVLGPLTALPIDTPVFRSGPTKGLEQFTYRSDFGPHHRKAIDAIGFAHQIEQRISILAPDEVHALLAAPFSKSLLDDSFAKGIGPEPVMEVRLKSHGQEVRQLWQARRPWPIYCDNGYTVSRLVSSSRGTFAMRSSAGSLTPTDQENQP